MAEKDPTLDTISDDGKGIESGSEQQTKATKRPFLSRELYLRILVLILVLGVTACIFVFRDRLANLAGYGYLGAFLISLLSSATILLPVPGIAVIFAPGCYLQSIPGRIGSRSRVSLG